MPVKGAITDKGIDISTLNNQIDLEDLGPVSGLPIFGKGAIDLKVLGPTDNVKFYFDVDISDFKIIGLKLGEIQGDVLI